MNEYIYATGKKKCSCAKVFLRYDSLNSFFSINNKNIDDFPYLHKEFVLRPLILVNSVYNFFIKVSVSGGGFSSQLQAVRHGVSKALAEFYSIAQGSSHGAIENILNFRKILKTANLLSRDSRIVERKKFGHKKARKREQYSKR